MDTSEAEKDPTARFELGGIPVAMDESTLLGHLQSERRQSIGFEDNGDIEEQREKALEYIKGEMKDVPSKKNRSSVVSSDIADAVETILPDLMEIFTGGEDIGSFKPQGEEDEEAAKQETDYINEVIFDQNPGFFVLESAVRDALEIKTGIIKYWWKNDEEKEERFEGKTALEMELASEEAEIIDVEPAGTGKDGQQLVNFTAKRIETYGCEKIESVDPQNFGVSPDTVRLCDTPYCIERSFPRAFQLLDDGYDKEKVMRLPPSSGNMDDEQDAARDTVDENIDADTIYDDERRRVEVHTHTIRIDLDGDGKSELWCIVTDCEEKVILDAYKKSRVGYAAGSPYRRAHRFYGFSVADKLIEVQKIKTSLMRMLLDNGYFALNQRHEVAETKASANTINDLLRNEPGFPVRSKTGDAVRPITSAGLNFDAVGALEYFSTVGEQRSGVVRNAQGLNPDTLHDTAKGAMALMTAAQRRIRMIARVLSETLLKDLFVGVHGDIREHSNWAQKIRLRNKWVDIDPTSWGNRADMTIEVGVGSGGRDMEILAIKEIIGLQAQAIEAQAAGIIKSPIVTEDEIYNASRRLVERLGMKAPELYVRDPRQPPDPEMQQQEEGPSPEEQAAMAEMQLEQQRAQAQLQLEAAKTKAQHEAMREKAQLENMLAREKAQAEIALAREKMQAEMELAREKMTLEAQLNAYRVQNEVNMPDNRPGGRLDQ